MDFLVAMFLRALSEKVLFWILSLRWPLRFLDASSRRLLASILASSSSDILALSE